MSTKKEFMLLFRYEPNLNNQPTEAELTEMQQCWGAYFGGLALHEKMVSTHQLGFEGKQVATDGTVSNGSYLNNNVMLGGNLIVNAFTMNEAVEIAKASPILQMGGTVEIRDILPI